ncbi:hypothetical protein, partial [Streptomyces sp. NPDC056081]|uniref:hypothetical protein n=1 Tax=Streptomyces sp. NPDC056081 TaxID=3345705 RepID=UPI0035DD75A4
LTGSRPAGQNLALPHKAHRPAAEADATDKAVAGLDARGPVRGGRSSRLGKTVQGVEGGLGRPLGPVQGR